MFSSFRRCARHLSCDGVGLVLFLLWLTCATFCCLFGVDQLSCAPARINYPVLLEPGLPSVLPSLMLFATLVSNVQLPSGHDVRLAPMAVSQLIALCATLTLSLTSQASNVLSGDGKMMFCVLVTCLCKGQSLPLAVTFRRKSYGSPHGTLVVCSKTT